MNWNRERAAGILAAGTAVALALSACSGERTPSVTVDHGPIVITVAYWGNFGLTEEATGPSLESVYEESHPWVDLEMISGDYGAQHDALTQALIAGSGAPNIAMVDEGYITEFVAQSDDFVNLLDLGARQYQENYLPWKWDQAATADGSVVIGLGHDVQGLALCYRSDLFEAAGLPSDRDDVSAMLGDSWDDFIAVGEAYRDATGKGFVDNATSVIDPAIWQLDTGHAYFDRNDELDMRNIKSAFDTALDVIEAGLVSYSSNHSPIRQWSPEWNAGFSNGDFAVTLCPMWMLDYIEDQIPEDFTGQWDIADLPGPGGNWGGSFYTIPNQGTEYEQEQAYAFLEWLIQPEQQLKIMAETGRLPAQTAILDSDAVAGLTNEFFNDAPYGEIYAKSVLDVPGPVYHGPCDRAVRTAVEQSFVDSLEWAIHLMIVDFWEAATESATDADQRCRAASG